TAVVEKEIGLSALFLGEDIRYPALTDWANSSVACAPSSDLLPSPLRNGTKKFLSHSNNI
ncbi:MAG: hypothetical protein ACI3YC_07555, partial [Alloprevotella sp.]